MGSDTQRQRRPMRLTLTAAAKVIDRVATRPLTDRDRYIAARHLQDRLAGQPIDRTAYAETYDLWATVKAHKPWLLPLLDPR